MPAFISLSYNRIAAAATPTTPAAEPTKAKFVGRAPESVLVLVMVLPFESVVVVTPVASATLMANEVLREVIELPASSVVVTVSVLVAVVDAVQADQLVHGAEDAQEASVQPVHICQY